MAWLFAASLRQIPSLLTPAFSFPNLFFSPRPRTFRSAANSRPIRFSTPRSIARRYCRPLQSCNARNKSTRTPLRGSFLNVLVTLIGRLVFAAAHLPTATFF